jgi:DNA-binding NarL/FixJ family response regulator
MQPVKIVLADDHQIVLDGLQDILEVEPDFRVVGRASNGRLLRSLTAETQPDLILLDLNMPGKDGLEMIIELKSIFPKIKILVLTMYDSPEVVQKALAAGADGYMLKAYGQKALLIAIREVLAGTRYVCDRINIQNQVLPPHFRDAFVGKATITKREKEVLRLLAQSYTNKEIGERLFLSEHTVATHRRNLKRKLQARSTAELTHLAYKMGLL